jgi:hypothetical protein
LPDQGIRVAWDNGGVTSFVIDLDEDLNLLDSHSYYYDLYAVNTKFSMGFSLNPNNYCDKIHLSAGPNLTIKHKFKRPTNGIKRLYLNRSDQLFILKKNQTINAYEIGEKLTLIGEFALSKRFFKKLNNFKNVVFLDGTKFVYWVDEEKELSVNDLSDETSKIIELPVQSDTRNSVQTVGSLSSASQNWLCFLMKMSST